jgi:hypothetical protein
MLFVSPATTCFVRLSLKWLDLPVYYVTAAEKLAHAQSVQLMMAAPSDVDESGNIGADSKLEVTPDFKDPLGVKDPLSAAAEDESDEFDFDVRFIS